MNYQEKCQIVEEKRIEISNCKSGNSKQHPAQKIELRLNCKKCGHENISQVIVRDDGKITIIDH